MTATSGPGFSLKQENLGFACIAEIPCVVVNVMRGGPSTGLPTGPSQGDFMQARWGTHGDHPTVVLAPYSVREVYTETVRAFNLSESFRTPVILLMDEVLAHMREKVILPGLSESPVVARLRPTGPPETYRPYAVDRDVSPLAPFGSGYRFHVTGLYHDETGFPTGSPEKIRQQMERLMGKIDRGLGQIQRFELTGASPADVDSIDTLVVAYGSTARAAKHAVGEARQLNRKVALFRPVTLWPFPEAEIRRVSAAVRRVVVPEMSLGQLAGEVQKYVPRDAELRRVNRVDGIPIAPEEILDAILT